MYQVAMYYTIKTLLDQGKSIRAIARELKIDRKTVTRIRERIQAGQLEPEPQVRDKCLDVHQVFIEQLYNQGLSAHLIHRRLVRDKGVAVGYSTLCRYLASQKTKEAFVPLLTKPGEEAQVDFGYLGLFEKEGKPVKVWIFCLVLSYSRYAYYQLVTDQKVSTFLSCHIHAFEYLGGVPARIKLDNLKAGVVAACYFEPTLQAQYSQLLSHYQAIALPCQVASPHQKGKVESGVKYVKNNFLKGTTARAYHQLDDELRQWNEWVCNQRLHGTTRKVPFTVFTYEEKACLNPLPPLRYQIFQVEYRKVNAYGHVAFGHNFYSVPFQYVGEQLLLQSNGSVLKIYKGLTQVALHALANGEGQFITLSHHLSPTKQKKEVDYYQAKAQQLGPFVEGFLKALQQAKPDQWHRSMQGVFHLHKSFEATILNKACERALFFQQISYQSIKRICTNGLYKQPLPEVTHLAEGFHHDLSRYDSFITPTS